MARRRSRKNKKLTTIIAVIVLLLAVLSSFGNDEEADYEAPQVQTVQQEVKQESPAVQEEADEAAPAEETIASVTPEIDYVFSLDDIPAYDGELVYVLNDNMPLFTEAEMTTDCFETYSELDELGRCGVAYACVGEDTLPTKERGNISHVKPTGWVQNQYDFVNGKSLYNRCHLIAHQLTGEDANWMNLITGTRTMNEEMIPFENMVGDYVKETGGHVLYRVTPIYDGDNLVASGVQMEAWSVEDEGESICYHVYLYNVEPGVVIDYVTGENYAE